MTKLTQEQKEELLELSQTPTWDALLSVCKIVVENHEKSILTYDLNRGDRELALMRAKLDGIKSLQSVLANIKLNVKGSRDGE